VHSALAGLPVDVLTTIAGLGGRAITKASLREHFIAAMAGETGPLTFLDLNRELVERELQRLGEQRRSGPHAENMLRDLGAVAAGPV
jgi:pyruvate ferredoxin oxidoreductase alpha subunit